MSTDSSRLVLLAAEFMFAVLFLHALVGYLRRRDPLQRDVTLVFAPCMVLFCVDLTLRIIGGGLPYWGGGITVLALLIQPVLTVRLAARLRAVPRWLELTVLAVYVGTATPLAFGDKPRELGPIEPWIAAGLGILVGEIVAAWLLFDKARTGTGANRVRLMIAACATLAWGLMIVLTGAGALQGTGPVVGAANRVLALACGLCYLVAFMPPRWLRRVFSTAAAQSVTERLLHAPVDSAEQVWQIYAEIMRVQTGADAVAVLMPRTDGLLAPTAFAGPAVTAADEPGFADITALIRADRPARLREGGAALVAHYGDNLGDNFVTVLSMPVPPDAEGAVLLFNRHRSLFSDDDLRLLAALGGQAGILADRSACIEALTRASQAKNAFLANMSHELRTPLNAIIGFSDLMRLEEPEGDRRRVPADWVEHIHTSGRHLLGLINDILDLAKVEAGQLDLRPAPLRVDLAVSELLTGLAPLLITKDLTVTTTLPETTALADRVRFRQIVENLLSNAIKFTPEGGSIIVSVAPVGDAVEVTVADTGVGIAPADQAKIFAEFQQVGDPDQQRAGTGLGLALTKRLVEAHDGTITVVSTPGKGSAFTVRLPAPQPDLTPDLGARVLIEDDPQSAKLFSTQLAGAGYHVDVADDGEAGLTAAGAHPPAAIVLDVALPGLDGQFDSSAPSAPSRELAGKRPTE